MAMNCQEPHDEFLPDEDYWTDEDEQYYRAIERLRERDASFAFTERG